MTELTVLKLTAMISIALLCLIFFLMHMLRLIKSGKVLTVHTIKMQLAVILGGIVLIASLVGVIPKEALTALLGAIIGVSLGGKDDNNKT